MSAVKINAENRIAQGSLGEFRFETKNPSNAIPLIQDPFLLAQITTTNTLEDDCLGEPPKLLYHLS